MKKIIYFGLLLCLMSGLSYAVDINKVLLSANFILDDSEKEYENAQKIYNDAKNIFLTGVKGDFKEINKEKEKIIFKLEKNLEILIYREELLIKHIIANKDSNEIMQIDIVNNEFKYSNRYFYLNDKPFVIRIGYKEKGKNITFWKEFTFLNDSLYDCCENCIQTNKYFKAKEKFNFLNNKFCIYARNYKCRFSKNK